MRDSWRFWSWLNLPNSLLSKINRPWKRRKRAGSIPAVGGTRPRCRPTQALFASRLRLQFVAHCFIHPESEQRIPNSLLATDNTSPLPIWTACRCAQSSLCPVYRKKKKKKVSSAIHGFLTHTHSRTSIFVRTQQTHQPFCKHDSGEIICLMHLHFSNDLSKWKLIEIDCCDEGKKKDRPLSDCTLSWYHWTSNALRSLVPFREKMWALYFIMD